MNKFEYKAIILPLACISLVLVLLGYTTLICFNSDILSIALNLPSLIAFFIAMFLYVIYLAFFHKRAKAPGLISATFIIMGITYIWQIYPPSALSTPSLVPILLFVNLVSSLRGFKQYGIIITSCSFIICNYIRYINGFYHYYTHDAFIYPCIGIGFICFAISMILFCTTNKIPRICKPKRNSEDILVYLKDELEFGRITQEEYDKKRADIISKL